MGKKIRVDRCEAWASGYFKPVGKWEKRKIHKECRKTDLTGMGRGAYSKIGVHFWWS